MNKSDTPCGLGLNRERTQEARNASAWGSQKSPLRPIRAKIPRIWAASGRRDSGSSRVEYHATAICQSWSMRTDGLRGLPRDRHQSSMLSSDRKKSITLQV